MKLTKERPYDFYHIVATEKETLCGQSSSDHMQIPGMISEYLIDGADLDSTRQLCDRMRITFDSGIERKSYVCY